MLHWKGGLISQVNADLPKPTPPYRTSEDTVSLIGRLAVHYADSIIAKSSTSSNAGCATHSLGSRIRAGYDGSLVVLITTR